VANQFQLGVGRSSFHSVAAIPERSDRGTETGSGLVLDAPEHSDIDVEGCWSKRRTIAFVALSSAGLWVVIGFGLVRLLAI